MGSRIKQEIMNKGDYRQIAPALCYEAGPSGAQAAEPLKYDEVEVEFELNKAIAESEGIIPAEICSVQMQSDLSDSMEIQIKQEIIDSDLPGLAFAPSLLNIKHEFLLPEALHRQTINKELFQPENAHTSTAPISAVNYHEVAVEFNPISDKKGGQKKTKLKTRTVYKCEFCNYGSFYKSDMKIHHLIHTGEKPFGCDMCSYSCRRKSSLKVHKLSHTGEKPFACDHCAYKSYVRGDLNRHRLIHAEKKAFACTFCTYTCHQRNSLEIHKLTHTGEKTFLCDQCNYRSYVRGDLNRHKLKHTADKPYACDECPYRCRHKCNLKAHKLIHYKDKPYVSDYIQLKDLTGEQDKKKSSSKDAAVLLPVPIPPAEKRFACDLCPYICRYKNNLRVHKLTHTGEKAFGCDQCGYRSYVKSDLKRHKVIHTRNKSFACEECNFTTHHKHNMKKHKITHSKDRVIFSCDRCSYSCLKKIYYDKHVLTHADDSS